MRRSLLPVVAAIAAAAMVGCASSPNTTGSMARSAPATSSEDTTTPVRTLPEPPVAHFVVE